jgi:hypothetical protein
MVMVVEKAKEVEEEVRAAALEAVLKEAHELFVMFYGSIRALLHKHPAGDVARSCLHAFMPDYFAGKFDLNDHLGTIISFIILKGFCVCSLDIRNCFGMWIAVCPKRSSDVLRYSDIWADICA